MATKSAKADQFTQRISIQAAQTAAGGDILVQIPTAFSPKDKTGLIIHRIDYHLNGALEALFVAPFDRVFFGLAYAQAAPLLLATPSNLGSIDWNRITREELEAGTLANARQVLYGDMRHTERKFTDLPGGGLLCHPSALYFWAYCAELAGTPTIWFDIIVQYTTIDLSEDLYRELWEMRVTAQTT